MGTESKLAEFLEFQEPVYAQVCRELAAGHKKSHWMWFIFPQIAGLGFSAMSRKFELPSLADARSYLDHPVLGARLRECTRLLLALPYQDIQAILGYPDDLKFRSCMTLFAAAAPDDPLFPSALDRYFNGKPDPLTVKLLEESGGITGRELPDRRKA